MAIDERQPNVWITAKERLLYADSKTKLNLMWQIGGEPTQPSSLVRTEEGIYIAPPKLPETVTPQLADCVNELGKDGRLYPWNDYMKVCRELFPKSDIICDSLSATAKGETALNNLLNRMISWKTLNKSRRLTVTPESLHNLLEEIRDPEHPEENAVPFGAIWAAIKWPGDEPYISRTQAASNLQYV